MSLNEARARVSFRLGAAKIWFIISGGDSEEEPRCHIMLFVEGCVAQMIKLILGNKDGCHCCKCCLYFPFTMYEVTMLVTAKKIET